MKKKNKHSEGGKKNQLKKLFNKKTSNLTFFSQDWFVNFPKDIILFQIFF